MTHEERVRAVIDCGFTERQARFLVLVMRHGGVCIPRQYASFAGIANGGRRCNAFFDRLVRRGYAHEIRCVHNRARVYHVHHKPLYFLIGEVSSRYRRAVSPRLAVERLMLLDAVLDVGDVEWLTTAAEKAAYLEKLKAEATVEARQQPSGEEAPRGRSATLICGPDRRGARRAHTAVVPGERADDRGVQELPSDPCCAAASGSDLDDQDRVSAPARSCLRRVPDRHP